MWRAFTSLLQEAMRDPDVSEGGSRAEAQHTLAQWTAFDRFPASSSGCNYLIRCAVNIGFFAFESVGITGGSQVQAEREWFEFSKWTTR